MIDETPPPPTRWGEVLGLIFAGYVPLAFQSPYPIIVYSVANYRPHLSHFWANMSFSRSQLVIHRKAFYVWVKELSNDFSTELT